MRVRTDIGAFATAGVVSAGIEIVTVGPGGPLDRATIDAFVLHGLLGAAEYLTAFASMHLLLRSRGISGRWIYAGAGSLAALAMVLTQTPWSNWEPLIRGGVVSRYLLTPVFFGAVLGFIYLWRAGLEADQDDPARLASVLREAHPSQRDDTDGDADLALIDAGGEEYFEGPVQVRTSLPIALIAALACSGLFGMARIAFGTTLDSFVAFNANPNIAIASTLGRALGGHTGSLILFGLVVPLPMTFVVLLGHVALRALNRSALASYVGLGLSAPLVLLPVAAYSVLANPDPAGLAIGTVMLAFYIQAAILLALGMGVYRSMAGIEPKPVREDILLNDRRNLVGAAHPRRQYGRLVKG